MNAIYDFQNAIQAAGLGSTSIVADGLIHRFATPDDKHGKQSGWYCLHDDQHPAGQFGDWRTGLTETWTARPRHEMSHQDRVNLDALLESIRQQRTEETTQKHADSAQKAAYIWSRCKPAPEDHPYLVRKVIKPHGTRQDRHGNLVMPLLNIHNQIRSLQFIAPDGTKRLLTGGEKRGCFFGIGCKGEHPEAFICEGFATGASIFESSNKPVFVAIDSGNLKPVAEAIHAKYPDLRIIIACDDDWQSSPNVGLEKGIEAARAVNGRYVVPNFEGLPRGDKDSDFNDLARLLRECGQ